MYPMITISQSNLQLFRAVSEHPSHTRQSFLPYRVSFTLEFRQSLFFLGIIDCFELTSFKLLFWGRLRAVT